MVGEAGKKPGALSSWQKARADFIISCLASDKDISIVDIGCGDGSILNYIKNRSLVSRAVGIDVSAAALEKARSFGIETVKADINNPSFLGAMPSADYVSLLETLEHIPGSEAMLKAAYGRAGRGVFFSFPNTGFFTHRFRLLFGRFPAQWRIRPNEHLRFWTLADLNGGCEPRDIPIGDTLLQGHARHEQGMAIALRGGLHSLFA